MGLFYGGGYEGMKEHADKVFRKMIKRVYSKRYDVGFGSYPFAYILAVDSTLRQFVEEKPKEAISIYYRARDWKYTGDNEDESIRSFLKTDIRVGRMILSIHHGNPDYEYDVNDILDSIQNKVMDENRRGDGKIYHPSLGKNAEVGGGSCHKDYRSIRKR